jgi:hypothetical protein
MSIDRQPFKSGCIMNGKAMPYDFLIFDALKETWARIKGFKATNLGAYTIMFLPSFIAGLLSSLFDDNHAIALLITLTGTVISYPLIAGYMMLGVKRAANLPVTTLMVLDYFKDTLRIIALIITQGIMYFFPFAIGILLTTVATKTQAGLNILLHIMGLGFFLFAIYLFVSYTFALPLLVEKRLSIWSALEISRQAVTQHFFKIFMTLLLAAIILVLSAIPLGIGLIWTIPFMNLLFGALYRLQFGVNRA